LTFGALSTIFCDSSSCMVGEDSSASVILFVRNDFDGNNSSSGTTLLSNGKIQHFWMQQ
jgi:hypothetical protein